MLCCLLPVSAAAQQCTPERTLVLAMDLDPESQLYDRARKLYDDFFARIDWCAEYRVTTFARSMEEVRQGKFDGDYFRIRAYGDYVPDAVRVEEPIAVTNYYIYARDARFKVLTDKDAFRDWSGEPLNIGYSQGIVAGMEAVDWLREHTAHHLYNIPEQHRGMRMLAHGRLDLFLGTQIAVDPMFGRTDLRRAGVSKVGVFASHPGYLYLNKRFAFLVPKLEQAIRDSKADGSFERIVGFPPTLLREE